MRSEFRRTAAGRKLSPFEHPARMPVESFDLAPVAILTAVAVGLAALGLIGIRRRGIDVT